MAGVQTNIRTFYGTLKGPGRTAPSLLENLSLYDPRVRSPTGANLLRDSCLDHVSVGQIGHLLPEGSCQHAFITKPRQTSLPALDERPARDSVYKVAALCRHCRIHVTLTVDYTIIWEDQPCPNADNPLHHLVPNPWRENLARNEWASKNWDTQDEIFVLDCSSSTCSATLSIQIKPPVLDEDEVHTLVDKETLKRRTDEAFKTQSGQVEGMKYPTPMDVLVDLRKYIRNTWTKEPRSISLDNKRFIVRFGPEGMACRDVLETLKFNLKPGKCWEVPKPNLDEKEPFQDPLNTLLDNAEHELSVLILQRPKEERQPGQEAPLTSDATRDFSRALGCQDYDKAASSRAAQFDPSLRPAPYTGLGVPENAADKIIIFGYERQKATDPAQSPWYLSYFKKIASARSSETLETYLATELSAGRFDAEQLVNAYAYFGLSLQGQQTDDEHIIGIFNSRLQDARRHESEMRERLRMIGEHRQSSKIVDFANDSMNTYDQALIFLGADATTADEFIESLYTTRTVEDPTVKEKALKAVVLIAEHRNSKALLTWVDTGKMGESRMDAAEAYMTLQIPDRTTTDDMILSAYQVAVDENKANVEYFNKALKTIAAERQSSMLLQVLSGKDINSKQGSSESPVGLENIGNTCYLNSLLQFLFTLPELRNIVIGFDKYKMEISAENMSKKQVGRRPVTMAEVQTAQRFVASLSNLFQEMITSPSSSITPQQELARLTLESEDAKQKIKRRSTIASGGRPSLGHIDSMPIQGPFMPPTAKMSEAISGDVVMSPIEMKSDKDQFPTGGTFGGDPEWVITRKGSSSENVEMKGADDNSSEATLVSRPSSPDQPILPSETREQQQDLLDNKENLLSKGAESPKRSQSPEKNASPLSEVSASVLNSQAGVLAHKAEDGDPEMIDAKEAKAPAVKPPPVPPRPQPATNIRAIEEYARQQDVTEVIQHCLFQLSCAMRPLDTDKDGEQVDEIKNLFYGRTKYHYVPEKANSNDEDPFSFIITRLYSQPEDIYAALDTAFDLEEIENGTRRFVSIKKLPPIFTIQLDRVSFDSKTQNYKKVNHHVELRETIFLDRYLEAEPDSTLMERRKQTWECKEELNKKLERQSELEVSPSRPNVPNTLDDAKYILEGIQNGATDEEDDEDDLNVSPETIEILGSLSQRTRTELDELKTRSTDLKQMVASNFTDMRKYPYRLHAAFFHRGTQGSGHYWVYIYDFKQELWRKYNDGYVAKVENLNEIFARPSESEFKTWSGPANPYLLVYVKEGEQDRLVESLFRNIVYPPPAEPPQRSQMEDTEDVEMTEVNGLVNYGEQSYAPPPGAPPPKSVDKIGDWPSGESINITNHKW